MCYNILVKGILLLLLSLVILVAPNKSFAKNKWVELSLGAGLSIAENNRPGNTAKYFTGTYSTEPRPFVMFRLGPIAFSSEGAGMAVVFFENFKLIGTVFYEGEPYEAEGMVERKRSIFVGGVMQVYSLLLMGFQDIESRSNGKIFKLISRPEFKLTKNWVFSPRFFFQYWDDHYVDYYFGVADSEQNLTIGRNAY